MLLSMKERLTRPLLNDTPSETAPTLSPDGRWLAFVSSSDVYVAPYPVLDRRFKISTAGGLGPRWSKDGHELIYPEFNEEAQWMVRLMTVDVLPGQGFKTTTPRILFELPGRDLAFYSPLSSFDVTRDGQHIIGATYDPVTPPPPAAVNIILNWFDELRAKVPIRR